MPQNPRRSNVHPPPKPPERPRATLTVHPPRATRGVLTRRRRTGDATPNMRTVAVLATVGAARAAAAPDRVAWGARRRAAPALEAEAVPRQDAPRAADDGAWWAAAKSGESAAELERMSSLLRRQLQDGAYSYLFTEGPSTMPSPQPSPMPSAMPVAQPTPATKSPTPDCGDDSLYTLTLTDTDGADGWGGETYTISSDSATVETGTLSSGAEDAVQFCLADGAYTLALSGAGTAVEFASGGLGLQSGPISVPFEAAGGDVNAAPTAKPTPAPSDAPVPAPTPKPTVSMAPSPKPIPAPTAAPVFAPTPKPTLRARPGADQRADDGGRPRSGPRGRRGRRRLRQQRRRRHAPDGFCGLYRALRRRGRRFLRPHRHARGVAAAKGAEIDREEGLVGYLYDVHGRGEPARRRRDDRCRARAGRRRRGLCRRRRGACPVRRGPAPGAPEDYAGANRRRKKIPFTATADAQVAVDAADARRRRRGPVRASRLAKEPRFRDDVVPHRPQACGDSAPALPRARRMWRPVHPLPTPRSRPYPSPPSPPTPIAPIRCSTIRRTPLSWQDTTRYSAAIAQALRRRRRRHSPSSTTPSAQSAPREHGVGRRVEGDAGGLHGEAVQRRHHVRDLARVLLALERDDDAARAVVAPHRERREPIAHGDAVGAARAAAPREHVHRVQ